MFVAWGAHQKPGTAAKFSPGSKALGVVQPTLGSHPGAANFRVKTHPSAPKQGGRFPSLSPALPPWDLPCRAAGEEAELRMPFLPEGTSPSQIFTATTQVVWPLNTAVSLLDRQ